MPDKPRIYLDNCCFNRPYDAPSQLIVRLEAEAVLFIQEEIRNENIELIWSYILAQESGDNPFENRRESIGHWRSFTKVDVDESEEVIEKAEFYHRLGLKPKDALHVACAVAAEADSFITTDKGILKKKIERIQMINPMQFIQLYMEAKEL